MNVEDLHWKEQIAARKTIEALRAAEEKLRIATEALEFYALNDIHSVDFNWKDNGKQARDALAKIRTGEEGLEPSK